MSIGVVDRKALWGRAASTCAFPRCRRRLFETDDEVTGRRLSGSGILLGEEAHIRSPRPDGPRHDPTYEKCDGYANLILLCPTHHTLVDKDGGVDWPVERLEQLKEDHEQWVGERLSPADERALETEILVAAEVTRLEELIQTWPTAYWTLSQPIPHVGRGRFDVIADAGRFLLSKDWPEAFPAIRVSAERLRHVISMLAEHIVETFHSEANGKRLRLDRPEKRLTRWDPPAYDRIFHHTQVNMVISWWLADALTLEMNNWIRCVRADFDPHYRFSEGLILVPVGDGILRPVAETRFEYDRASPPVLPVSRAEIAACVEHEARERAADPQDLLPNELAFPHRE